MDWERPRLGNIGWGWIVVGWIVSVGLAAMSLTTRNARTRRRARQYVPSEGFPPQPVLSQLEELVTETREREKRERMRSRRRTAR
jgi:hypothetical protein